MFLPTPPKGSIGGNKPHQLASFEFAKTEYDYLVFMERFIDSTDFTNLDQFEKTQITEEYENRIKVYEVLRQRIEKY